jgi:hypothetical protein
MADRGITNTPLLKGYGLYVRLDGRDLRIQDNESSSSKQNRSIANEGRPIKSVLTQGASVLQRNAFAYWLSAKQDGGARVRWVSFTPDLAEAPVGHTYTELQIEARWQL